jgi:hypothetical protein
MSYNPPDLKYEIRDTLFCLGVPYEYQRINTDKGHVWSFFLPDTKTDVDIYGPKFIRVNKKRVHSTYEAKLLLMNLYKHLI